MIKNYIGLRLLDDFMVTVCSECNRACCWQGEFMCDDAKWAGTREATVAELKDIKASEHWRYWEKDSAAKKYLLEVKP